VHLFGSTVSWQISTREHLRARRILLRQTTPRTKLGWKLGAQTAKKTAGSDFG
jgi:hypothetical protein